MGLFDKLKSAVADVAPASPAAPAEAAPAADGAPVTGKISMTKGSGPVSMRKTKAAQITMSWPDKTDYDAYCYVVLTSGEVVAIAAFAAGHTEPTRLEWVSTKDGGGKVVHHGDVGRGSGGMAQEIITITWGSEIVAVVFVVYSAQSNGTGSFRRYQVSTAMDNGAGDVVEIPADSASDNDHVYTLVPGVIYNDPTSSRIERLELYSTGGEKRPAVSLKRGRVVVKMDQGPRNDYK